MITHGRRFGGLSDLMGLLESPIPPDSGRSSQYPSNPDWDLGLDWDGAVNIARAGGYWPAGRERMSKVVAAAGRAAHMLPHGDDQGVVGHTLVVPDYVSGIPDCWIQAEENDPTAILTIGVSVIASAGCHAEPMFNRGAAVLSLVDSLETQGIRCRLSAVYCARWTDNGAEHLTIEDITVKDIGDHWNIDKAAFMLAHPGFMRRILLGMVERGATAEARKITNNAYGIPCGGTHSKQIKDAMGYDIFIPELKSSDGRYETIDGALQCVMAHYRSEGAQ